MEMSKDEIHEEIEPIRFEYTSKGREPGHGVEGWEDGSRHVNGGKFPEIGFLQEAFPT